MKAAFLLAMNACRAERRGCVLVSELATGAQRFVRDDEVALDPLAEVLAERLRLGKSGMVEHAGAEIFLDVHVPPVRLIAIGAVHISQALAPLAKIAGFDMVVIDPRTAFANDERFPDVQVIAEWPDVALPPMKLDRYTAMAFLTHDPKIDDPALEQALRAECFYLGALGSRKTHGKRVERLSAKGFSPEQIGRIHAPIGLDIGAVSPSEIAISIVGEIIASLRKKPLRAEKGA